MFLFISFLFFCFITLQILHISCSNKSTRQKMVRMIIKVIRPESENQKPKKKSWHHKFRSSLYFKNYQTYYLNDSSSSSKLQPDPKNLISFLRKGVPLISDPSFGKELEINQRHCTYIPLKRNIQMEDELTNSFLHLRILSENSETVLLDGLYTQIRKFIRKCKNEDRVGDGWRTCLKKLICRMDVIERIQIYEHILKYGTKQLNNFHKKLCKECIFDIFYERVMQASRYFKEELKMNHSLKVSVEIKDQINEITISKTMKMLYCPICLIYDCGKHKFEALCHKKQYHFVSPKNKINKNFHILQAINLCQWGRKLRNQPKPLQSTGEGMLCCSECYKALTRSSYLKRQSLKVRLISPMVESLIKIGVQMFSYAPCLIKNLFPKQQGRNSITCSTIYIYLEQEGKISSLLDNKINNSEQQLLFKEILTKTQEENAPKELQKRSKSGKKKRSRKNTKIKEEKYQEISLCYHSFIGEDIFDHGCLQCDCRKRGFCMPDCQCPQTCSLQIKGCLCKGKDECQTNKCQCYQNKAECIPGVCVNCFTCQGLDKKNYCTNDQILRRCSKMIRVGRSKISNAGLGAFAGEPIRKNSLISIYCGEVVEQEIENIRQIVKKDESFYNFGCYQGSTDARYMGNKTRFINHANENEGKANLISLKMLSEGQQYIALYALRNIKEGEELYFDYDISGEMGKKHGDKYPFLIKDTE